MSKKFKAMFFSIILFVSISGFAQNNLTQQLPSGIVGHWTFNNSDNLSGAVIGNSLVLTGNHEAVKGPNNSGAVRIGNGSYYRLAHGISPNGGGKKVNSYTMMMDIRLPVSKEAYTLLQTDIKNKNDGDWQISEYGIMGVSASGYPPVVFIPGEWYRVAISVLNGKRLDYYIDGVKVLAGIVNPIDGRFSLESEILLFADNNGEDYSIDVADIKLFLRDLSDTEIEKMGGFKHSSAIAKTEFEPYLQSPTATSIYVCWSYFGDSPSIEYGLSSDLGNKITPEKTTINGGNEIVNWYSAKLENLTPSTIYYYKVKTDKKESQIYKFKTQPENENRTEHIRFAIYGDNRTDFKQFAAITDAMNSKVRSLYGDNLEEHLNFIFNVGDIVTRGAVLSQYYIEYFNPISSISPYVPLMISIGNHESESSHYYNFMKYKDFGGAEGDKYYSFRIGSLLLVSLNSNTQYRNDTQIDWMNKVLTDAENDDTIQWVFVFLHHPGHSELWTVGNTDYVQDRVIPELTKFSKVDLLSYGHSHNYERGTAPNSNLRLMLSGGAGGGLDRWHVLKNIKNYPEIQKSFDHYCYSIVDIDVANKRYEVVTYSLGNPNKQLNNVEIDRFFRDKKNETPPEKPLIIFPQKKYVTLPAKLEASGYSGDFELMSSQFQITRKKGNYNSPLVDVVRDFENIYSVTDAPDYTPINLNAGIDLSKYVVKGIVGRVWVRVRYRDKNLQWSDWSEEKKFTIDDPENSSP